MNTTTQLRVSGILATVAFVAVFASDVLMLTDLDTTKPYRFWVDAPGLRQSQVTFGYYLGELVIPLLFATGWHLAIAVQPAGRWAAWTVLAATGYCLPLVAVWHAAFPFTRSVLRAELAGGTDHGEAALAFATYALPLFRIGLIAAALSYVTVFALALLGRTLYPRWAGVALPATYVTVALLLRPHAPVWADLLLGAGGWNLAGAILFAMSVAMLWKGGVSRHTTTSGRARAA